MTKKQELVSKYEGKNAPKFTLPNQKNEKVKLSDFAGDQNVLLYFYPKDMTSGCTLESIGFSNLKTKLKNQDVKIFGVSKDSVERHKKFCEKESLKIDLLSDEEGKTLEKYGVWVEKSMYGKKYMGISRESFLIGKNGKVLKHWIKVKPADHPQEVLDFVKTLDK